MSVRPSITFAGLVAPIGPARFLSEFWTKTAVHLPGVGRTFDDVFSWEGVEQILNAQDLTFPKVKVSRNDHPVPAEKFSSEVDGQRLVNGGDVMALFRDGASFGITNADTDWPPLGAVIDCLYDTFLEQVHTNVYCSPPNTQGFQCHFDLHEVFVLQVDGSKHWRVFKPTIESPIESWKADDAPGETVAPYIDVVLKKGDVLYVPRGHWHYAVAQASASVHVTVGITCHKATSFIDWLANELVDDPLWRRNLPLAGEATTPDGEFALPTEWSEYTEKLRASLLRLLADPAAAERFCRATLRDVSPLRRVSTVAERYDLELDHVVFERPPGRRHFFEKGEWCVTITSGGCEIELDDAEVEFCRKMFAADSFTANDIRAWRPNGDVSEVRDLLAELVQSGLLRVRPK